MARQNVVFDNFIFGDTGRRGPLAYHYGRRKLLASYGHWRGLNTMRYLNGGIGPRPPFSNLNLTVQSGPMTGNFLFAQWMPATGWIAAFFDNGDVWGTMVSQQSYPGGIAGQLGGYGTWYKVGNLGFTPSCAVASGIQMIVGRASGGGGPNGGAAILLQAPFNSFSITAIANMPSCNAIVAYKEFVVTGRKPTADGTPGTNVLWFSDRPGTIGGQPGLFWTNNSVQQVAVGTNESIAGLFVQKNALAIPKVGGDWYTMTGAWDNGTIRKADVGLDFQGVGAAVRQSNIWYPNGRDIGAFTGAQTIIEPLPDFQDTGTTSQYFGTDPSLAVGVQPAFTGLAQLEQIDEFILTGAASPAPPSGPGYQAFIRHGAAGAGTAVGWTRHTLPYGSQVASSIGNQPLFVGNALVWNFFQNNSTNNLDVFQFDIRQEIPYAGLGGVTSAGDPRQLYQDFLTGQVVKGEFHIPEWWAPDGSKAQVAAVLVDFDYDTVAWQTVQNLGGDPSTVVGFDVNVDALNLFRADGVRSSRSIPWAPPQKVRPIPASNAQMVRHRAAFKMGEQGAASGFRVNVTNMRGVQLYRVVAVVDLEIASEY